LNKYSKIRLIDALGKAIEIISPDPASGVVRDCRFRVDKTDKRAPDKAEITLYNLPETLRSIAHNESEQLEIYFSTEDNPPPMIFKGEITDVVNDRNEDFTDYETRIYAEDSKNAMRVRVVARTWKAGTPLLSVFQELAIAADLQPDVRVSSKLLDPISVLLPIRDAIKNVCSREGLRCQIIDHRLVIREFEDTVTSDVPLVSKSTGLIGIPVSEKEKRVYKINFQSKLNPKLIAGGACVLETTATMGSRKAPIKSGSRLWIQRAVHVNAPKETATTDVECRAMT
jgi:hypothetical protein